MKKVQRSPAAIERWERVGQQIVVISGSVLAALISMALVPALPAIADVLGGGTTDTFYAQSVVTIPAVGFAFASPITSRLVLRFGLRRIVIASLLLFLASSFVPVFAPNKLPFVASRLLLGIAGGVLSTATLTIAGNFTPTVRDRLLGFTHAGGSAAAMAALVAGGVLVDRFGWRAPFSLFAVALPVLVVALVSVRETPSNVAREILDWAGVRLHWMIYLTLLLLAIGFFIPGTEGPFLLIERSIVSASSQGLLLSILPLTSVLVSIFYGALARRIRERDLVVAALLTTGVGLALCGAARPISLLALGFAISGVGAGLAVPVIASMLIVRTDAVSRVAALGLYFTVMFLAQFATPLLIKLIKYTADSKGVFLSCGFGICIFATIAGWYFSGSRGIRVKTGVA